MMFMQTECHLDNYKSESGNLHHLPYLLHQLPHGHNLSSLLCRAVKNRILSKQKVANTDDEAA